MLRQMGGAAHAVTQGGTLRQGQAVHIAKHHETDILAFHARHFLAKEFQQQAEQRPPLRPWGGFQFSLEKA